MTVTKVNFQGRKGVFFTGIFFSRGWKPLWHPWLRSLRGRPRLPRTRPKWPLRASGGRRQHKIHGGWWDNFTHGKKHLWHPWLRSLCVAATSMFSTPPYTEDPVGISQRCLVGHGRTIEWLCYLVCVSWTIIGQPGNSVFICRAQPG